MSSAVGVVVANQPGDQEPETLAAFSVSAFILSCLWAMESGGLARWSLCGSIAAANVLVRTVFMPFVLMAPLLAWRDDRPARSARVFVTAAAAVIPLAAYGFVAKFAFGAYGITFFDGASTFALVAQGIDCSDPTAPPSIRRELCLHPELLDDAPWKILWDSDGAVQRSVRGYGWPATNRQLRELVGESLVREPRLALSSLTSRAVESMATVDPPYAAHPEDTALPYNVATDFPQNLGEYEHGSHRWNAILTLWYRGRLALFGLAALASALCWSRIPSLHSRDGQTLSMIGWGIYFPTICTTYVTPRLMYPLEIPAVLLSLWLVHRGVTAFYRGAAASMIVSGPER